MVTSTFSFLVFFTTIFCSFTVVLFLLMSPACNDERQAKDSGERTHLSLLIVCRLVIDFDGGILTEGDGEMLSRRNGFQLRLKDGYDKIGSPSPYLCDEIAIQKDGGLSGQEGEWGRVPSGSNQIDIVVL